MTVDAMIAVFNNEGHYSQLFFEHSFIKQEKNGRVQFQTTELDIFVGSLLRICGYLIYEFSIQSSSKYMRLLEVLLEFRQLIMKNFCIHNTHTYNLSNRAENHEQKLQNGRLYQRTLGHSQHLGVEPNEAPPAALSTPCGNNLTLLNLFFLHEGFSFFFKTILNCSLH